MIHKWECILSPEFTKISYHFSVEIISNCVQLHFPLFLVICIHRSSHCRLHMLMMDIQPLSTEQVNEQQNIVYMLRITGFLDFHNFSENGSVSSLK
jgi:hypothetical protein